MVPALRGRCWVADADVYGETCRPVPVGEVEVGVALKVCANRNFFLYCDAAGAETCGEVGLDIPVPLPELVASAAYHMVAVGVYRCPASQGARGAGDGRGDEGEAQVPSEEGSVGGGIDDCAGGAGRRGGHPRRAEEGCLMLNTGCVAVA